MGEWKETEIGRIPIDWEVGELGEICELITDGAHNSPAPVPSKNLMTSVKDMRYSHFDFSDCKTISQEDFEALVSANCSPQFGDILVSKDGANCLDLIFVYRQPERIVLLSSIAMARLKKGYDPDFYRYFLLSPNAQFLMRNQFVSGSAIPRVVLKDFKNVPLPLVPFEEQKSIASILSSLDDKIDLLQRQNATLEAMAETFFRQWFVEETKEEWEDTTLQNHVEALRGLSYKGSGLTERGLGLPMHNLNSVYEGGGYKYEGIKYYSGEYKDRHRVYPGDIIVTNTEQGHEFRLIGFPAIVPDSLGQFGLFSQHLFKLTALTSSYLTNEFLYYLLMSSAVREQIISATNGSTVNMLAMDGLQRPEFRLPPEPKVTEFTAIVRSYWNKKKLNEKQIQTLVILRDMLLPKLMSGEVRGNNMDIGRAVVERGVS